MTSMGIVKRKKSLLSNSSETHLNGIPLKICDKTSTLCKGRKVGNGVANYNYGSQPHQNRCSYPSLKCTPFTGQIVLVKGVYMAKYSLEFKLELINKYLNKEHLPRIMN